MPDPQDMTGVEKMVADSRAAGKPVKVKDLATAIRQQFNPPGELSDGAVVKYFGAANPQLGMDQLQFDLTGASSGGVAPAASTKQPSTPPAESDDIWNAIRRGSIKGLATAEDWANNAAHLPADVLNRVLPSSWSRAMGMAPGSSDPGNILELARRGAQMERAKAEQLPAPTGLPATVASAIPEAIGYVAPYMSLGGAGGAAAEGGEALPLAQRLGRAVGTGLRTQAPRMAAVEAIRASQGGPGAMAEAAAKGAAVGGVGFPVAEELMGALPGISRLPGMARRFTSVAAPTYAMSEGTPEERAAAGISYGLIAAPGAADNPKLKVIDGKAEPVRPADTRTAPPPSAAATASLPGVKPPETPPAAAPPAPRNDRVIQVLRREGTKKPVSIDRIRTITGADTRTAGKIMSQLLEDGVIDSSRNVLAGAPAATTAPPPPPAAPAATATAPPPAAPVVDSVAAHNARAEQIRKAGMPSKVIEMSTGPTPPAPPIGLPVVNTAPPAAPTGSTLRVVPLPAATEVPTVSIPTPQSIAQGVIPKIRQAAMAAQGTTPPPTVTPEQLAAAEVMQHGPAGVPGSPAPVVQMPSPAAAPAPPEAAGAPPAPVIQMPTPDEAPVNPRSAAAKKAWATRRAKAGTAPPPEPVASAGRTEPEASAQPPEPAAPVVSAAEEAAALQRIKSKFSKFAKDTTGTQYYDWKRPGEEGAELGPEDFQDLYTIGKGIVRRAGESFEDWKNQFAAAISMPIEQFRAFLEPHLMPIWQQVTQGARPSGAAGPPPGAASTAAAALPPSQPQYLQWDALHGGKPAPTPPPPDVPPPPGAASWQQWLQSVQAQGMPPEEIERRAAAATEPRIQGPLVPAGRVPLSEFEYKGAPTAIQNPSAKLPPTQPPPTAAKNPILANVGASPSGRMQAFQQAMANSGVAPLPPEAGDALEQTGFAERQNVFTGGGSGSGKKSLLSPVVLRDLPTGSRASEVWTKPVQEGTIEIQRNGSSGEFTATKYYTDGTQHTIHGIGDDSLRDYLQGVQQRELPRRQSQQVSRSSIGAPPFDTSRIATGPPPEGMTTQQTADAVAEAVRNLERSTRSAPTIAEIQRIIMNATQRSQSEQAKPPDKRMPIPEKLAQGVTDITGGQALDVNRITRIISDAVARRRVAEGLPAPEKTAGPLPADIPIVDTGTKAVQRRVKVPEESQFAVADKGAGNWLVTPKDGGETNVFIQKEEGSRFFNVYIGNRLMRKTSTLTAAKLEAVNLAEQQAEAGEGIKRQRGRPSNTPLPKVVVTPVAAPAARKISLPQQ